MSFRVILMVLIVLATLGAVAGRASTGADGQASGGQTSGDQLSGLISGLTANDATSGASGSEESGLVTDALPYVTEGGFFAVIGFALGYVSRKVLKLGLIILAVFFVGVQALSYAGVVTVDWGKAVELANDLVLNVKENQTLGEIVKDRLPSAGGLLAGYALGFRKG